MRNLKRILASALVGLSIVASTATAFAAGSITGIVENPQVDLTGATIDGQEPDTSIDYSLIITNAFDTPFYETEEGEALVADVVTPLNEGTATLSQTVTAYDAADPTKEFDLSNYEMLTPLFNAYVVDSNGVVYDNVENATVSFDVNTYSADMADAVRLMYYDRVLGDWVICSDFTVDGQTFTVTLPMVPTAITVIYDASVVASATGMIETNSAEPIYFAFGVLLVAGCALIIFRKRYAK